MSVYKQVGDFSQWKLTLRLGLTNILEKKVQRWISFLVRTVKLLIASYDIKYSDV